jgi:hypothetical protein
MDSEPKTLTLEEFVSLLVVGDGCAITDLPSVIPAEHSARLIALGFIADLFGRLRMTTPGRLRIAAGFENTPLLDTLRVQMKKLSTKTAEHNCPACNGTGFPVVMQPIQPGRRIYPVQCKDCSGKGRIAGAVNQGGVQNG